MKAIAMPLSFVHRVALAPLLLCALIVSLTETGEAQIRVIPGGRNQPGRVIQIRQAAGRKMAAQPSPAQTTKASGPVVNTASLKQSGSDIDPKFIRFHLWDGSIVGGKVAIDKIDVETEFGTLHIPVEKIVKFYPGLNSLPELNSKITRLVEGLVDKNFDVRERSHRELVAMGLSIRHEINRFDDNGSAERKKHLNEIRKTIEQLVDEAESMGELIEDRALIRGDTVVTKDFTVVGKILQDQFQMQSKFGNLTVKLADIKMGDRSFNFGKSQITKSVQVGATAFFQKQPVSTRIRVNRGDKIKIRADGVVQWTNWNSSSTPEGLTNQGQWQGINSGRLVARIGDGGKYIDVGSKSEFTAKTSGILYLGIAVRDNYANNPGYRWSGHYNAKIQVKPAP